MEDLPDLCLRLIADELSKQNEYFRRKCDVIKDVAVLCVVSKQIKMDFVPLIVEIVQPPNEYETLVLNPTRKVKVKELKDVCRSKGLYVSGNSTVLKQRLKVALEDERLKHCGLGRKLCMRAQKEYCKVLCMDVFNKKRIFMGLEPINTVYIPSIPYYREKLLIGNDAYNEIMKKRAAIHKSLRLSVIMKESYEKYGTIENVCKERDRLKQELLQMRHIRKIELKAALENRGVKLRMDSELCNAFINGTGNMSITEVVDATEEIAFFYRETSYSHILRSMRFQFRDYERDFDRDFGTRSYWRARECYDCEYDEYDCSDEDEDEDTEYYDNDADYEYFENDEEHRREKAKRKALSLWFLRIMKNRSITTWKSLSYDQLVDILPTSFPRSLIEKCKQC